MPKKPVIIDINLLPKDPFFETSIGKVLKWGLSVGRYIVIFTELIVIVSFIARFSLDRQVTDLNDKINQKKNIVESYGDLESNYRILQKKIEDYKQVEQQTNIAEIFPKLSAITPNEIRLEELRVKQDSVSLGGLALSQNALNILITNMQLSSDFLNVKVDKIESQDKKSAGIQFSISASTKELVQVKQAKKTSPPKE